MNMTLVTIDSGTKSNEVNTLVRHNFGNVKLWIGGLMSRFPSRHFIWLASGKPFSYTNWQGNNPDFYGNNEYCAHIGRGEELQWNDIACNNHQGFICENSQQQNQENKQLQHELENERINQQELQQQLQQKVKNQQELQQQLQEQEMQQIKLKQELDRIKESAEQDNQTHLQSQRYLKQEIEEQQDKLKNEISKFEGLQQSLNEALEKQQNLQQQLQIQQDLKDLFFEELQKLKEKQQMPTSDVNKKYRDIILHFHQN